MRLAFQLPVIDSTATARLLLPYFQELSAEVWDYEPNLHLTVFHVGRPKDISREISLHGGIDPELVAKRLVAFSNEFCDQHAGEDYAAEISCVIRWNHEGRSFCVLGVRPDSGILSLRKSLVRCFGEFLVDNGIHDPDDFFSESRYMNFRPDWTPHITIGVSRVFFGQETRRDVPSLGLRFGAIRAGSRQYLSADD